MVWIFAVSIVINLEYKPYVALYRRLSDALRKAILEGRLKLGDPLPSVRELSKSIKVSNSTTSKAYDDLKKQGLVVSKGGSGTFVAETLPGDLGDLLNERLSLRQQSLSAVTAPVLSRRGQLLFDTGKRQAAEHVHVPALEYGGTPVDLSPVREWKSLLLKYCDPVLGQKYSETIEPLGLAPLREAIADYVLRRRSIAEGAGNVCVFGSKQLRVELVGRLLIDPGNVVAYEEPGYPENRNTLQSLGAIIAPVPVDQEGMSVEALRQLESPPRLICVTPSHHDPLGYVMSLRRRHELLEYAHEVGAFILEDDFDYEFSYGKTALPAIKAIDPYDCVIYMASFWRVLYKALRLSFIVLPNSLVPAGSLCKSYLERHLPLIEQLALTEFINEGQLEKHLKRIHKLLALRRQALILAVTRYLKQFIKPLEETAGTHLMLKFDIHLPPMVIECLAWQTGFNIMNSYFYYCYVGTAPERDYIVPFATVDCDTIDDIVKDFADQLKYSLESGPNAD